MERCGKGDHAWVAVFFESGRLAYWECERCGMSDREVDSRGERIEVPSGWVDSPCRLTARGAEPPATGRRWTVPDGTVLVEGDPSSTDFVGIPIPGLAEAHSYVQQDSAGEIRRVYQPSREQIQRYADRYWLTRFQVVGDALLRFESYCHEDSTFEIPHAGEPERHVVLQGLAPGEP